MANRTEIPDLQGLIKDTIEGEVIEQHAESLLPPGENYGSVMYKVDFKVKHDGKEKEYHAVAKCTPLNKVTQEIFNTQETFKSEIGWYTTVIPTYRKFQREQGVDKEIDFFQKFFGARISLDSESDRVDLDGVILTENLKNLGYRNEDRHKGFDLETTHSVLRDLAAFHAIPIAIRQENPELFEKNIAPYLSKMKMEDDKIKVFYKLILKAFDDIPSCNSLRERVEKNIDESHPFHSAYREGPWITVTHNDFWVNNIMVTDDENPKTIILDLQTPVLGSPVSDVVFVLLTSVNLDVIRDRVDYFLRFYFDELLSKLEALKASTEMFKFEEFLEEVAVNVKASQFTHALGHTNIIMGPKGQTDFDSSDADFDMEQMEKPPEMTFTDLHRVKFEWLVLESAKREWL